MTPVQAAASQATRIGEPNAVAMAFFFAFIAITLGITYWAARRTRTTEEFYAAGRTISAGQNGFALAGDYMSAASFLGIAGLVSTTGFDGLIYSTGWLVGWPVVLFLIAEPLRNLGKYTFADVVSFRMRQTPVRIAAIGHGGWFVGPELSPAKESLLLTTCNWLLARDDRLPNAAATSWQYPRVTMTDRSRTLWTLGTLAALPGFAIRRAAAAKRDAIEADRRHRLADAVVGRRFLARARKIGVDHAAVFADLVVHPQDHLVGKIADAVSIHGRCLDHPVAAP